MAGREKGSVDMNIRQAKEEIKNTVRAYLSRDEDGNYRIPVIRQRPILLMGPPGVGKTQIMEQIARECRIGLVAYTITHHTRQSAVGLPLIEKQEFGGKTYSVTEYTMSEIIASVYRQMKETGLTEGILFIDEINCVSETLAPTMLQFLQCKTFGSQAVPEGWIIVAAGNPPEYNKSVRDFDMVTLDRVRRMDIEADFSVWKEYAREHGLQDSILTYLELRPQNFYRVENDVDGIRFVTARGWEDLSSLMDAYGELGIPVTEEVICQFVSHREIAMDVAAYVDLYRKYEDDYGIMEILDGKVKTDVYTRLYRAPFDERLSVVHLLLSGLDESFRRVAGIRAVTDGWYDFLREFRRALMDAGSDRISDASELYDEMAGELESSLARDKKSGFLTREDENSGRLLLERIRGGKPDERSVKEAGEDVNRIFELARIPFEQESERLELAEKETGNALEHAFDFMEHAFSDGQEMVLFVTELTLGRHSSAYIAEHECPRYHRYNKELMLGTKRAGLLSEIHRSGGQ